jgi:hypothetical protein
VHTGTAKVQLSEEIMTVGPTWIPRGISFFVTNRENLGLRLGGGLLFYNVHMSETKPVRLTETVKAAG